MDNIKAKLKYIDQLREQGLTEDQIEVRLEAFDQVEAQGKQGHESALLAGRAEGSIEQPAQDLQDLEKNSQAVHNLAKGMYDPRQSTPAPDPVDAKMAELRESISGTKKPGG
jgi:hypothetical protein